MKRKEKIKDIEPKEEGEIPEEKIEKIEEKIIEKAPEEEKEEIIEIKKAFERRGDGRGFRRRDGRGFGRREEKEVIWVPKTKLGKLVKEGKIKDIDEIFEKGLPIMEAGIVDTLLPGLESDLILIGQAKGKFGGGKRRAWRQTQKKTAEENVPSFACMTVIGDGKGHVGLGYGKAKETLPAREKAMRNAKLGITRIERGCGSFDCACSEKHSIPLKVSGKCGSAVMVLIPAPKGTGLAIEDECKKIMKFAGIKDIYSRSFGQTRSKINLAKACMQALKETTKVNK